MTIMNLFVEQTNLYSTQKSGRCVNTTYNELSNFLGIHVMSSIVRMPSYKMYWAQETRNRFEALKTAFHINDNSNCKSRSDPVYDKLL